MEFRAKYVFTDDGIGIVELHGALDIASAEVLRELLGRLVAADHHRLVLNLHKVDFIDSAGLGVLTGAVRMLRPRRGLLAAAAPSAQTRKVMEITQLSRFIPSYAEIADALDALRGIGATGDR